MKYGHLLNQRRINSGYGLRLTEIRKKSLVYISEGATMSVLKDYGSRCRQYTVNVLAVYYTDFWAAYNKILPTKRHHIERFHLTMRQRVSRLVRKTLSFSKKLENHIGAIWNFIHHYNLEIAPRLSKITTD